MTDQSFGKAEKLKLRSQINQLFAEGKTLKSFPVKLLYLPLSDTDTHKVGVSVPKRSFKRAVDRNHLKRLLRESYRLNKHFIKDTSSKYGMMFIYMSREKQNFHGIFTQVEKLLNKLAEKDQL